MNSYSFIYGAVRRRKSGPIIITPKRNSRSERLAGGRKEINMLLVRFRAGK